MNTPLLRQAALAALTEMPGIPERIVDPNTLSRPERLSEPWLSLRLGMTTRSLVTLPADGGTVRATGSFTVIAHVPLGDGPDTIEEIVDVVVAAFPQGQMLGGGTIAPVTITGVRRWSAGTDLENGWYSAPVDVMWRYDEVNNLRG